MKGFIPVSAQKHQLTSLEFWNYRTVLYRPMRTSMDVSRLREVSIESQSPDIVREAIKDAITSLESLT